jgi:hypothetical protein
MEPDRERGLFPAKGIHALSRSPIGRRLGSSDCGYSLVAGERPDILVATMDFRNFGCGAGQNKWRSLSILGLFVAHHANHVLELEGLIDALTPLRAAARRSGMLMPVPHRRWPRRS